MTKSNFVELALLVLVLVVNGVALFVAKKKLRSQDGLCGVNHNTQEEVDDQLL